MTILGLHHITLICSDAQQTVDFYTRVLGQRFVKKTVNFDDPGSYHLYFGDELGHPGTAITFFEWPGANRGNPGIGGTHHFALTVSDYPGLLLWKRRLTELGISVAGPFEREGFTSISFQDPDGTNLEITNRAPAPRDDSTRIAADQSSASKLAPEITPAMALDQGMHHITAISSDLERTHELFGKLLGLELAPKQDTQQWTWCAGKAFVSYVQRDPRVEPRPRFGAGQTHHFAFAVEDDKTQLEWRKKLTAAGLQVTPVMDRMYFKSIYTNDPDGHIVELATLGPGFAADEKPAELGTHLTLPPWFEKDRAAIEAHLKPIKVSAGG